VARGPERPIATINGNRCNRAAIPDCRITGHVRRTQGWRAPGHHPCADRFRSRDRGRGRTAAGAVKGGTWEGPQVRRWAPGIGPPDIHDGRAEDPPGRARQNRSRGSDVSRRQGARFAGPSSSGPGARHEKPSASNTSTSMTCTTRGTTWPPRPGRTPGSSWPGWGTPAPKPPSAISIDTRVDAAVAARLDDMVADLTGPDMAAGTKNDTTLPIVCRT
jgi:hypothetical protein